MATDPPARAISRQKWPGESWFCRTVLSVPPMCFSVPDFVGEKYFEGPKEWAAAHQVSVSMREEANISKSDEEILMQSPTVSSPIRPGDTLTLVVNFRPGAACVRSREDRGFITRCRRAPVIAIFASPSWMKPESGKCSGIRRRPAAKSRTARAAQRPCARAYFCGRRHGRRTTAAVNSDDADQNFRRHIVPSALFCRVFCLRWPEDHVNLDFQKAGAHDPSRSMSCQMQPLCSPISRVGPVVVESLRQGDDDLPGCASDDRKPAPVYRPLCNKAGSNLLTTHLGSLHNQDPARCHP